MNILIVDDEPHVRMLLSDMLEPLNCKIDEAEDCLQAFEMIKANKEYKVALVDWRTPKMSGLELVEAVRKDPHIKDLPILMITGLNEIEQIQQAITAGANEYLMKPFVQEAVFDKLRLIGFDVPDQ